MKWIVSLGLLLSGTSLAEVTYADSVLAWRADRESRLRSESGWLTLVGLHDISEGVSSVGSDSNSDIVLSGNSPTQAGTFALADGIITYTAPADVIVSTRIGKEIQQVESVVFDKLHDADPAPLRIGSVSFYPIARSGRYLLRVKDSESEVLRTFEGLQAYPPDPGWRIEARFEMFDVPGKIPVPSIIGTVDDSPWPGNIHFQVGGEAYTLAVLGEANDAEWFTIFADETNGVETYGAGRFIVIQNLGNGKALIDFNKAYSPPCLFTPYATCPLPPEQNRLSVRIEAGEMAGH